MSDLDLSIGFDLNTPEVNAELDQTRERLRGVGGEAVRQEGLLQRLERAAKLYTKGMYEATRTDNIDKYNRKLQATQEEIKRLTTLADQNNNKSKSSFNGLQNSINQISRELPAFTYSAQTGFMAVANNIPILTDQISNLRAKNAELIASGQKATPVWKQLVSGLFSWGTAMSVGITLLTVYGKEIGNWIGSLFQGKDAVNSLAEQTKITAEIQNEAIKGYAKEVSQLNTWKAVITDATLPAKRRNEAVEEYNKIADKANQIDKQSINNTALIEAAMNRQIDLIQKRGLARAAETVIAQKAEALLAKQFQFDSQYSRYSDDALKAEDERAFAAINAQAKKTGVKNINPSELLAQSLLPDAALQKMAEQDKKFAILLDAGTKKILKEVVARKAQIESIRKNETGGYAGVAVGVEELERLKGELDQATNLGLKYIKDSSKQPDYKAIDGEAKKAENEFAKALEGRKGMLEKLRQLDDEYRIKSYDKDEEERQALKDKFADFRRIIQEENDKIAKYNKDHKNKVALIDVSQVDPIEQRATADLVFKQQTAKLSDELAKQKALFQQYEEFKTKAGAAEADKRFKADLNGFKNYGERLQAEIDKINQTPADKLTGGQLDLLSKLKEDKEAYDADKKNKELQQYAADLQEFQTYAEKRLELQNKYLEKAAMFRAKSDEARAQEAINRGVEEVTALDEANVQKWDSYKNLFDNIHSMSKRNTLAAIEEFKKELSAATLTDDARAKLEDKVNKLKSSVERGSGRDIERLASDLSQIAGEFSAINSDIGNIASVLLNSARSFVDISKGLKDFKAAETTGDKIGAGLGIVGAGLSVVNSVVGWFKGLKAAKEAAKKAMNEYQQAAIKGELDYQALLRKREQDEVKRGKNSYRAIVDQLELLKKQSPAVEAAYKKIFASLQGQSFVDGVGYKHGTWFRKAKTWDIMASLAGSDYAELEKLYTQGKLKDQAKADFESLKALKEELKAAGVQVEELQQQLAELLTGTTVGGLADGLSQLFENGKFAAEDFGQSFESIMKNAIVNSFKAKVLQDQMQPFFDDLAGLMTAGTPTADQVAALKQKYQDLGAQGAAAFKQLEAITGIKLTNDDPTAPTAAGSNTMANAIKGISADQADLLAGQVGGLRLGQLENNQINRRGFDAMITSGADQLAVMRQQHLTQMEIAANTLRTANNTDNLRAGLTEIKDGVAALTNKVSNSGNVLAANGKG